MIKELRLKDWKSFEDGKLYIDPLTIIIGNNASGKSNTLDALLFLNRVANGISIFQSINGDVNLPSLRGGVEWVCRKPKTEFTLELLIEQLEVEYLYSLTITISSSKAEIKSEKLEKITYTPKHKKAKDRNIFYTNLDNLNSPSIPTYFYTATQGRGRRIDLNRSHLVLLQAESLSLKKEVIDSIKAVLTELRSIFVFDPIPSHMRDYSNFADQLMSDGSNLAGVLAALEPNRKEEVENLLTQYIKDIPEKDINRVWTEPVGKFKTDAMIYCEEGFGSGELQLVDARGMSDGTLRYLGIVTAMLTRQPGQLLVIEEVDNGLHPSRAHLLLEMLKKIGEERNIDVVVTTHNPALLDAAGLDMIPFISVAHREAKTGFSKLTLLEDISSLPKLVSMGTIGKISTTGDIESALKREAVK